MHNDLAEVLISAARIEARVGELATRLAADYAGLPLSVVIISNGSLFFAADLLRALPLPLQLDTISASSYTGTRRRDTVDLHGGLRLSIANRHVLLLDDIYDSGMTLQTVSHALLLAKPASLRTCVLLRKQRSGTVGSRPDYVGFEIADTFVVGYGLDFRECYRNLPYIGVLHAHLYASAPSEGSS